MGEETNDQDTQNNPLTVGVSQLLAPQQATSLPEKKRHEGNDG